MIVDSSALIAIALGEQDAGRYADALQNGGRVSAATLLESNMVIDSIVDAQARGRFEQIWASLGLSVEPFTEEQARIAAQAHRDFGRRSGSPARLNFGDCISYALAKATGEPLLYKGNDFVHTDVRSALES
ncbi:MAG TPA: type II toxin-antitoxin system VapC family toxin [Pseudolysinimonas sp.]